MKKANSVVSFECVQLNNCGDNGPFLIFGIEQLCENGLKTRISEYVIIVNTSERTVNTPKNLIAALTTPQLQDRLKTAVKTAISKTGIVPKDFEFSW